MSGISVFPWYEFYDTTYEVVNRRCSELLNIIETRFKLVKDGDAIYRGLQQLRQVFYEYTGCDLQLAHFTPVSLFAGPWHQTQNMNALAILRSVRKLISHAESTYKQSLFTLLLVLNRKKDFVPRQLWRGIYARALQQAREHWAITQSFAYRVSVKKLRCL